MITGGFETVLAGRVGHGTSLAVWVHVTVRAPSVAFRVRLFLELDAIALRVRGTELSIFRQISRVRQDRGVLLTGG